MFNEESSLSQINENCDFSRENIVKVIKKYHFFPDDIRCKVWGSLLRLPKNADQFNYLKSKIPLKRVKNLCGKNNSGKEIETIFNALVYWYAPIITCDWMPIFLEKLVSNFPGNLLFCFETTICLITNFFQEWISDIPGPPPSILSRMDAIFSIFSPKLRNCLPDGLVVWKAYRSFFAEVFFSRNWVHLIDNLIVASPQFLEFLVIAWMCDNEEQIQLDFQTFVSTPRPCNIPHLIRTANTIWKHVNNELLSRTLFRPIGKEYPVINSNEDSQALRELDTENEKIALMHNSLESERKASDQAEFIKKRKQETFDSIQELLRQKEENEHIEASKAAIEMEKNKNRMRLDGILVKQAQERQFLDQWKDEWSTPIDLTHSKISHNELIDVIDDNSMINYRSIDLLTRQAHRIAASTSKNAMRELETQTHQKEIQNEVIRILKEGKIGKTFSNGR